MLLFSQFSIMPIGIALAALLFSTYGDAFSTIVGVKFGRRRIFRRKSLEGFLAFLSSAFVIAFLVSVLPGHQLPLAIGLTGASVAALTELFSVPPDDNFSVTVLSGLAMFLTGYFVQC